MANIITCRARVVGDCLHGQSTRVQFGEDLPMHEDGTFDGESIVCDACYMALCPVTPSGQGLNHELSAAIEQMKAVAQPVPPSNAPVTREDFLPLGGEAEEVF